MSIIRADNLTKLFGPVEAVNHLSLEVKQGEIYGLVGPDGAGKTTTIRLLTSIMNPTSGQAWVDNKNIVTQAEEVKEVIGYMSQKFGLYQDLTVIENLTFYAEIYGLKKAERQRRIDELLQFSQLTAFKDRLVGNLSGGMKQKLGLSCALIHTPKVLFLDEPTTGVDPISRRDFWQILYQLLKEKVTIFISTAYMDEAERCQHVGFIYKGSLLASGTPTEMKALLPGEILEVHLEQPRKAARLLQTNLGEEAVTLFGDHIHILTKDRQATEEKVKHLLSGTAAGQLSMQPIPPSLEDVFIALLSEKSKDTIHANS